MLEQSHNILYLTVSICAFVFTVFLVWIMYYLIQIMKQSNEIITEDKEKLDELEVAIQSIKERVSSSATSIAFVAKEIKSIVEFVQEKKGTKKK